MIRTTRELSRLSIAASALLFSLVQAGEDPADGFVGEWVDSNNSDIRMTITEESGLLRIEAGDDAFGYQLACVRKDLTAKCLGHGGKLEGEDFLYQSILNLSVGGAMAENWNVYNNLQSISDQTLWKRP